MNVLQAYGIGKLNSRWTINLHAVLPPIGIPVDASCARAPMPPMSQLSS